MVAYSTGVGPESHGPSLVKQRLLDHWQGRADIENVGRSGKDLAKGEMNAVKSLILLMHHGENANGRDNTAHRIYLRLKARRSVFSPLRWCLVHSNVTQSLRKVKISITYVWLWWFVISCHNNWIPYVINICRTLLPLLPVIRYNSTS
jgi:hypothetical protein